MYCWSWQMLYTTAIELIQIYSITKLLLLHLMAVARDIIGLIQVGCTYPACFRRPLEVTIHIRDALCRCWCCPIQVRMTFSMLEYCVRHTSACHLLFAIKFSKVIHGHLKAPMCIRSASIPVQVPLGSTFLTNYAYSIYSYLRQAACK